MEKHTTVARKLRNNMTEAEKYIWYMLRSKNLNGFKFRRQQPIGSYIVDFICLKEKLIIEIDGGQHNQNINDTVRDNWLKQEGFRIVRFWNNEVLENRDSVLEKIINLTLPLTPPLKGGE